ncbi:MAG: Fur family transcriptional regulator [Actinomycetota bacterium]|nr:Fur family transcriptional regulator [Actinomycetota bacterium]
MNQKIKDLVEILKGKNIKPSYQRVKILEYLVMRKNHPTVDKIFKDLVKEIPTLSRATVYNTLDLFKRSELARVVTIEDNETRYDAEVSVHGHFKCENCGNIFDFPVDEKALCSEILGDFMITEKNVYFKGICPKCRNTNK